MCWCLALTQALRRQRQGGALEDKGQSVLHGEFQVNQGYIVRPCRKKKEIEFGVYGKKGVNVGVLQSCLVKSALVGEI